MTPARLDCFDEALKRHLDGPGYRFYSPRSRMGRIERGIGLLRRHADPGPGTFLNVGCAAFVLEFLLEPQRPWQFVSLDLETQYQPLYQDLKAQGVLTRTDFRLTDVEQAEFPSASFDGIVAHDILFTPALELDRLLPKFARWLKPGGVLCFDVWDQAAQPLWKFMGRDYGLHRYEAGRVRSQLRKLGFKIVEETPYWGNSGVIRMARRALWACCRVANARYFLASKTSAA